MKKEIQNSPFGGWGAFNHYYTADVCTAETVEEQNELFKQLLKSI